MKTKWNKGLAMDRPARREAREWPLFQSAYTIIEVVMGSAVAGIMLLSLYAGFTFGLQQIRLTRQQERAAQILEEKTELVRLLRWDQLNQSGYVPQSFEESFYSSNPTNAASGNIIYSGQVVITNAPISESYSNDLRQVQVQVSWVFDGKTHTRSMTTFVSQYGMQSYIY